MKKVILFFVLSINVYSQQDTITVNKKEIISIEQDIHTQDQRTGYYSVRYFALIGSKTPLKGLYKVIDQKNYYHIVYFENGTEIPSSYLNVVKYYYLNKIYKIDIFLASALGGKTFYYSVNNFKCRKKKLKIYQKSTWYDSVEKEFSVKQKIEEKYLVWYGDSKSTFDILKIPNENICSCKNKEQSIESDKK